MKMVAQETVGVGKYNGRDVLGVQRQKVAIIPLFQEDVLPVDAPVIDVINTAVLQWRWVGHGWFPGGPDLTGFLKPVRSLLSTTA